MIEKERIAAIWTQAQPNSYAEPSAEHVRLNSC
jgi:hypothetical protein